MEKEDMRRGFAQGRCLIQEEWSTPAEIKAVDELASEGVCDAGPWEYSDNFQCERRIVTGIREPQP